MLTSRSASGRPLAIAMIAAMMLAILPATPVAADSTPQVVPYAQNWANTGLISADDDWTGVPGALGFLGQNITGVTGADPQTLVTESALANDVDVIANQTSTGRSA